MGIKKISLKNFTIFNELELEFASGINIFIGENGVGKTHIMKVLYSACQAADPKISFSYKLVKCFLPDDYRISRLARRKQGNNDATIKVISQPPEKGSAKILTAAFSNKTSKWDAIITGEDGWERQLQNQSSIFIPAKEILSNSCKLSAAVEKNNISFDDTYIDIINSAKIDISTGKNAALRPQQLDQIELIIDGKVFFDSKRDEFYLKTGSSKLEFNLAAEGIRKIALLWQLVKNGTLEKGAVLFWDEPEANINPVHIPVIVDMLLELQRGGVQIFVSTHNYAFAKYFDVKRKTSDDITFYSLYKTGKTVACENGKQFGTLSNNPIIQAFDRLLDEVYTQVTEG